MNITKRENAYRVRVFNGKDADGKFLYSSMTIRFDDPRFEGMTEKSFTRQPKQSPLSLNNRSTLRLFFPMSPLRHLPRDGLLTMPISHPLNACNDHGNIHSRIQRGQGKSHRRNFRYASSEREIRLTKVELNSELSKSCSRHWK